MAIEREIKLALPADQVDRVVAWLSALTGQAGESIRLENRYFDTPSLTLARAKSALRVRRTPDGWLQTYKTVGSASAAGLHNRHEWELPVAGNALEVDALLQACDDPASADALRAAAADLIPLFSTDFTRTLWDVTVDGSQIEAAVDQGEVLADVDGETRRTPIREVELELKHGDEAALHTLSQQLMNDVAGLEPDAVSKAQRGYRLREDKHE